MVWVKICGITNSIDVEAVAKLRPDAIGFILADSPRKITIEKARGLLRQVPSSIESVVVATPANAREGEELISRLQPDYLQIHNDLAIAEIKKLGEKIAIIKAIQVNSNAFEKLKRYEKYVQAFLLDSVKKGTVHNWDISAEIARKSSLPVILAGGLNPENVVEAISRVKPFGVDVASGVEIEGRAGVKNLDKIRAFIERAKKYV
ncbi:MAG: phosphoribosylanthranilate isomerase [Methanocellales archaeon]